MCLILNPFPKMLQSFILCIFIYRLLAAGGSSGRVYKLSVLLCLQRLDIPKEVIVLFGNGVLCYEQYKHFTPRRFNPNNIVVRPGLLEFFKILLRSFHVGIWSCMVPSRLKKVLQVILPEGIRSRLLFVHGRNKCSRPGQYPLCDKVLQRLSTDSKTMEFCLPDRVLMVDDQPMRHVFNGNYPCYFPKSWLGEMDFPNASNVIPDIATALLPFIYPLRSHRSVQNYLRQRQMDGKFIRRLLEPWHIDRVLRTL